MVLEEKQTQASTKLIFLTVLVAALGYFVDIYDLLLFGIVRKASLQDLGVPDALQLDIGTSLLNWQMTGLLIGGMFWGILGDKRGRLTVLFGSIIIYSLANIANGFVQDITTYKLLRFIAGIGLAGELGAGITLVSEVMGKHNRGWGTTVVAVVGLLGAVAAYFVSQVVPSWRVCYWIGGVLGLLLLVLRISVHESGMYKELDNKSVAKGDFRILLQPPNRLFKYIATILIGTPTWFVVGILVTFSDQFGTLLGVSERPVPGQAIMWCYVGLSVGDLLSGLLSQLLHSRKKVMWLFHGLSFLSVVYYINSHNVSIDLFYFKCFLLGVGVGYWAIFVTIASEQFGTNMRSTVTTTVPNFARGLLVPISLAFKSLATYYGSIITAAYIVGGCCLLIALLALIYSKETFGKNLDYLEE